MLLKRQRYPLRSDTLFFSSAKRVHHPHFTIFLKQKTGVSQAAVIVPKEVYKNAVDRNKTKRRVSTTLFLFLKKKCR